MPGITLNEIANITQGKLTGDGNQVITMLETDSRNLSLETSSVFIAIKGLRHDGHKHIQDLYERGLRNFIVARSTTISLPKKKINIISVDDPVTSLQKLAAFYRQQLTMPVIAITGSNGKTVVKEWLFQCSTVQTIRKKALKLFLKSALRNSAENKRNVYFYIYMIL